MIKEERQTCPHLGLKDDAQTSLLYPSASNICHKAVPAAPPKLDHQNEVCLKKDHAQCPVYGQKDPAPLPSGMRLYRSPARIVRKSPLVWLIVPLLAAIGLVLWQVVPLLQPGSHSPMPDPTTTSISQGTPPSPQFSTQAVAPSFTVTVTVIPSCGHALDAPFGQQPQLVIYKVRANDTLNMIAVSHSTTVEAIQEINEYIPSPLWAGWILVIPMGVNDIGELPKFEAVQVQKDNISIEALAQELAVDPLFLRGYNALEDGCSSFDGWLVTRPLQVTDTPQP